MRRSSKPVVARPPTMYSEEQVERLNAKAALLRSLRDRMAEDKEQADAIAAELAAELKPDGEWTDLGDVDVKADNPLTDSEERAKEVLSPEMLAIVTETVRPEPYTRINWEKLRNIVAPITYDACRKPKNNRPTIYVRRKKG